MLAALGNLADRRRDPGNLVGYLLRELGNIPERHAGGVHDFDAGLDGAGGFFHRLHRFLDIRLVLIDQFRDFLRRRFRLFGQFAHFFGHHREPASLLAGPGRFDRRIQRQQIGLAGNPRDHIHDFTDVARRIRQFFHSSVHGAAAGPDVVHLLHSPFDRGAALYRRIRRFTA